LDVQDCHFRNFIHSTSYFGGQPFLTNNNDHPDTTIFINNTFFACNAYIFSIRGAGPKAVFSHNTIAYTVVNPFETGQGDNMYINNNLFYAVHGWGGNPEQIIGSWLENAPDTVSSSVFQFKKKFYGFYGNARYACDGPEAYYKDLNKTFDPSTRTVQAHKNVLFNPDKITSFYTKWNDTVKSYDSVADYTGGAKVYVKRTLTMAPWLNNLGKQTVDSLGNPKSWDYSSHVSVDDALNSDPSFSDAATVGHIDSLVNYVKRIATSSLDNGWQYKMVFPPAWPVPEKLVYTNSSLLNAGTDGFAIGDLNWFPTQKASWLTGVKTLSTSVPKEYTLSQNYPNPFNPETKIDFTVTKPGVVKISIYNILGQKIRTLINQEFKAGAYNVTWDGRNDFGKVASSGTYLYSLETKDVRLTKKMIFMK